MTDSYGNSEMPRLGSDDLWNKALNPEEEPEEDPPGYDEWMVEVYSTRSYDLSNPESDDSKLFNIAVEPFVVDVLEELDREEDIDDVLKGLGAKLVEGLPPGEHISFDKHWDYITKTVDEHTRDFVSTRQPSHYAH